MKQRLIHFIQSYISDYQRREGIATSYGEPLTFNDFGCSTVTVPSGSASAYQASAWYDPTGQKGFKEFVESGDISSIGGTFAANRNNGSIYDVSGKRIYVDGNHLPAGLKPGIYFIPALIDEWKASGHCKEFINFDKLETYKDFGGIRIEDDVLITKDGCRFIGKDLIPYHPKDVENFMANN